MKEKGRFKQFAAAGFCMFVCILLLRTPVSAKTANIKCGEHATAVLDDLGTLTIDGSGDMYDQARMAEPNGSDHIFQDIYTDVYRIVIGDKITRVGNKSFTDFPNVQSISIGKGVTAIGEWAFMNLENAMRGARNPMNSWSRMDSGYDQEGNYVLGPNDLDLAVRLRKAGSDHRKFIRQIFVSVDITAPLYWWKEYDTYKVATVANSTSTMHRIHRKPFEQEDFSCDRMTPDTARFMETVVEQLEKIRKRYLETKSKEDWYDMIQLLPSSYNQMRTCSLNYETLVNIYYARRNHKLDEWHVFCEWIRNLPYGRELIAAEDDV